MLMFIVTGCASNKGVTSLKQVEPINFDSNKLVILKDEPTRRIVLDVLTEWFYDNNINTTVIESRDDAKINNYVLSYRAWWGWDMATYMRKAEIKLKLNENTLGSLTFDALQYGGFGKFGDTRERLRILLDVLFGKIDRDQANVLLGQAK